ncbi:MAG: VWA domain-containing protein [Thermoanaerobaculia bacterium]
MSRRRLLAWMACAAFAAQGAAQEEPPPVWFVSPPALEPALGEVVVEIEVQHPEVREVRLLVDGRASGSVSRRPYRWTIDLGEEFGPHRFEAVVIGSTGELARASHRTPGLRVDDQVDLGLRQLYVALEGEVAGGSPLAVEAFTVIDDGARQRVVTFEGGDAALAVAVLVDASDSMSGGALRAALEGARALLDGLDELDEATRLLFADGLLFGGPHGRVGDEVERILTTVSAAGGTALNDALYVALRQLESRQGRRVIVLLSDGLDIHSTLDMDQVLWAMRRSGSVVFWIELRTPRSDDRVRSPWRTDDQHDVERAGLRRLVAESGGRVVPIQGIDDAAGAFGSILEELRSQYVLGYYPSRDRDDGAWHQVSVRVAREGIRARTRRGYVDD